MKDERSQFEKDKQTELFATNVDSDLLPIADSAEDLADTFKHQRCAYQMEKIKRCEAEILKIQNILLGEGASDGLVIRSTVLIEELQMIADQLLKSVEHIDSIMVSGFKTHKEAHAVDIEELLQKNSDLENRIKELEKSKRKRGIQNK